MGGIFQPSAVIELLRLFIAAAARPVLSLTDIVRYKERYKEQINPQIIDNDYEAIKERYQNIEKKFPDLAYESWPFFWPGKEMK